MLHAERKHLSFVFAAPFVAKHLRKGNARVREQDSVKIIQRFYARENSRAVFAELPHKAGIPDPDAVGAMSFVHIYRSRDSGDGVYVLICQLPGFVIQLDKLRAGIVHGPRHGLEHRRGRLSGARRRHNTGKQKKTYPHN